MATEDEIVQEGQLDDIYAWIANIPFSKPKKNLTRDFSNAVLMAEILKVYYPRYVDLHNYAPVNNVNSKISNWKLLNRRVFQKIDMTLTSDKIQQLATGHPGAIEHLLFELRNKISKNEEQFPDSQIDLRNSMVTLEGNCKERFSEMADEVNAAQAITSIIESDHHPDCLETSDNVPTHMCATQRFISLIKYLFSWILLFKIVFNVFRRKNRIESTPEEKVISCPDYVATENSLVSEKPDSSSVPHQLCTQLSQELREKSDLISLLNHKVISLESAVKLKDLQISNLTAQIQQNSEDAEQSMKIKVTEKSSPKSKIKLN